MTRLTDSRLTEIILQCDYATQHNQVSMVSTVEVAEVARELKQARAENARLRKALREMRSCLQERADDLEDEMHGDDGFMNNYSEMSGERLAYLDVILQLDKISTPSTQTENVREALTKIGELKGG